MNAESSEARAEAELRAMEAELRAKSEQLDQFLPYSELISIPEAFEFARAVASELGVIGYKTEKLLVRELRKENLTTTLQGPATGTHDDWLKSKSPASQLEYEEFTTKRAILEFFKRKAARRTQLDRERKRKRRAKSKLLKTKNSKNNSATTQAKKRTRILKKRMLNDKKRTR